MDFVDGIQSVPNSDPVASAAMIAVLWGLAILVAKELPIRDGLGQIVGWEPVDMKPWQRYCAAALMFAGSAFVLFGKANGYT